MQIHLTLISTGIFKPTFESSNSKRTRSVTTKNKIMNTRYTIRKKVVYTVMMAIYAGAAMLLLLSATLHTI